jgi:nitrous oxidase accessory protein NosD
MRVDPSSAMACDAYTDANALTLALLPTDLLRHILVQRGIGPRELCTLECTAWLFRQLADDDAWRHAFLEHRRCNVLREPECWKLELTRRTMWSRNWRQIIGSGSPAQLRLGMQTQKLRRFAQKMISGAACAPGSSGPSSGLARLRAYDTHVVDPTGVTAGCFLTITAALAHAMPFDVILVHPGEYRERLKVDKHTEIVGTGPPGSVVVIGFDGPAIEAMGRITCRLASLVIKQQARGGGGGAMSGSVLIKGGAVVLVEESLISSEVGHCVVIQGADSCGYILHNAVANGKGVGVLVCDNGRGVIEDNDISFNGRAGVAILSGGDPLVCHNKIHEGMDSGVLVSEKGRGRVEDNDIFHNRRAGVAILKEGAPLVKHNRIHSGRDSGVLVCENGQGSVVDNQIFANQMAGVAIGRGGASRVTGNTIRDGSGGSLCLSLHSKGMITSNVIHQHPNAAMQVPEGLMSEVTSHNYIRYEGQAAEAEARRAQEPSTFDEVEDFGDAPTAMVLG